MDNEPKSNAVGQNAGGRVFEKLSRTPHSTPLMMEQKDIHLQTLRASLFKPPMDSRWRDFDQLRFVMILHTAHVLPDLGLEHTQPWPQLHGTVLVLGAGDTAMDCATRGGGGWVSNRGYDGLPRKTFCRTQE